MSNPDLRKGNKESLDLAVRIVLGETRKQAMFGGEIYWESPDGTEIRVRPYNQEVRGRLHEAINIVEDFFKGDEDE